MLTLWSVVGGVLGAAAGLASYAFIIAILEPRLRALDKSETVADREAFEHRVFLLRRILLVVEVAVFAAFGYVVGLLFGG